MYLQGLGYLEYFAMHSHRLICCTFTHEDYNIAFRFMFSLSLLFNLGELGGPGEIGGGIIERIKAHAQAMTGSRDFFFVLSIFCVVYVFWGVCMASGGGLTYNSKGVGLKLDSITTIEGWLNIYLYKKGGLEGQKM